MFKTLMLLHQRTIKICKQACPVQKNMDVTIKDLVEQQKDEYEYVSLIGQFLMLHIRRTVTPNLIL